MTGNGVVRLTARGLHNYLVDALQHGQKPQKSKARTNGSQGQVTSIPVNLTKPNPSIPQESLLQKKAVIGHSKKKRIVPAGYGDRQE